MLSYPGTILSKTVRNLGGHVFVRCIATWYCMLLNPTQLSRTLNNPPQNLLNQPTPTQKSPYRDLSAACRAPILALNQHPLDSTSYVFDMLDHMVSSTDAESTTSLVSSVCGSARGEWWIGRRKEDCCCLRRVVDFVGGEEQLVAHLDCIELGYWVELARRRLGD